MRKVDKEDKKKWRKVLIWAVFSIIPCVLLAGLVHIFLDEIDFVDTDMYSLVEGVAAAGAAVLVIFQLRESEKVEQRHADVEEEQFVLEFNRSFIENKQLTEIERYLECRVSGLDYGEVKSLADKHQDLINYLVYLEGFSSCILSKTVKLERVDNLFAYRFFVAMNNPEVQSLELIPYAQYYRGCYQLFAQWMDYRVKTFREEKNGDIPMFNTALFYCKEYEKYATPKIKAQKNSEGNFTVTEDGNEAGSLAINDEGVPTLSFLQKRRSKEDECSRKLREKKLLCALLKCLLDSNRKEQVKWDAIVREDVCMTKEEVKQEWENVQNAQEKLYQEGLFTRQLKRENNLPDERLQEITKLIYDTDTYISTDMLGDEEEAKAVLPRLIKAGEDTMFNLDNLFVCEKEGKVIGMILWHKGPLSWSAELLSKARGINKNKDKMKLLKCVEREYMSGYSDICPDVISILDLCVSQKEQGKGVGKKMLKDFLQKHQNMTVELCVLSANTKAIERYKSCGFQQYGGKEQAYPKSRGKDHTRITMRWKKES